MSTETLRPNADGCVHQWTPSTGSDHYAVVDDDPADDGDYLEVSSNFQLDVLHHADTSASSGETINSVTLYLRSKEVSGDSTFRHAVRSGQYGSTYYGSTLALTTSFADYDYQWDVNPVDDQAWESTDIDAYCFGIYSYSGSNGIQCSQVYIIVDYGSAGAANSPTGHIHGPLMGPFGGPI